LDRGHPDERSLGAWIGSVGLSATDQREPDQEDGEGRTDGRHEATEFRRAAKGWLVNRIVRNVEADYSIGKSGWYDRAMTVQTSGLLATRGDAPLGDLCPMDRSLQMIGNRTALLLLREALYGATRFDQFRKRVGITEAAASKRLHDLVTAGVLEQRPYREPGQRTRNEYVLTPAGHDLMPVVIGLLQWGVEHASEDDSPVVTHDGCGAEVRAVVRCTAGHDVDESSVRIDAGRA